MIKEKENFDAEVVVALDKPMDFKSQDPALIQSADENFPKLVWAPLLAMSLSSLWKLNDPKGEPPSRFDRIAAGGRLARLERNLARNKRLFEIIREGRLKMAFLIDSDGGDAFLMDMFRDSVDEVARRGGKSYAYVLNAQSSALDIMMTTDYPMVKKDSLLMWHHATDKGNGKIILDEEEVKADIEDIMLFLSRGKGPKRQQLEQQVREAVANPSNPSSAVFFSGRELEEAGCVKQCFEDIGAMRDHFYEQFRSHSFELAEDFWEEKEADGQIVFNQPPNRNKAWGLRRIK